MPQFSKTLAKELNEIKQINRMEKTTLQAFEEAINSSKECGPHTGHSVMVITPNAARACYAIHKAELDKDRILFLQWLEKECYVNGGRITKYNGSETGISLIEKYQQSKDK